MAHFERKKHSQEIFQGKILRVTLDTVELENGKEARREVVWHHGGAGVIPLTETGEVYLVRQFRYALGREILEIPAGKLEPGEDPMEAARRELVEECGLLAEELKNLDPIYPSVGYDSEVIHLYLAKKLREVERHPDEDEFLDVCRYPLDQVVEMILRGEIRDGKTVAGILKLKLMTENENWLT